MTVDVSIFTHQLGPAPQKVRASFWDLHDADGVRGAKNSVLPANRSFSRRAPSFGTPHIIDVSVGDDLATAAVGVAEHNLNRLLIVRNFLLREIADEDRLSRHGYSLQLFGGTTAYFLTRNATVVRTPRLPEAGCAEGFNVGVRLA
jgi:hypothetical protein